jgi:hypothetical protein
MVQSIELLSSGRVFGTLTVQHTDFGANLQLHNPDGSVEETWHIIDHGWTAIIVGKTSRQTTLDVCIAKLKVADGKAVYVKRATHYAPNPKIVSNEIKNGPVKVDKLVFV